MAAAIFIFDPLKDPFKEVASAGAALRDARDRLKHARDEIIQWRSGDGSSAAHYALLQSKSSFEAGGYADANTATKAAFDELDSMISKLLTDASVSSILAAVDQFCAKYGV